MKIHLYQTMDNDLNINVFATKRQILDFLHMSSATFDKAVFRHIGKQQFRIKDDYTLSMIEVDSNILAEAIEQLSSAQCIEFTDTRNVRRVAAAIARTDRKHNIVRHHIDMRIEHIDKERHDKYLPDEIIDIRSSDHSAWHLAYRELALIDVHDVLKDKIEQISLKNLLSIVKLQIDTHKKYRIDPLTYGRMNDKIGKPTYDSFKHDLMCLRDGERLYLSDKIAVSWHYAVNDEELKHKICEHMDRKFRNEDVRPTAIEDNQDVETDTYEAYADEYERNPNYETAISLYKITDKRSNNVSYAKNYNDLCNKMKLHSSIKKYLPEIYANKKTITQHYIVESVEVNDSTLKEL